MRNKLKKAWLLVLVIPFLVACGKKETPPEVAVDNTQETKTVDPLYVEEESAALESEEPVNLSENSRLPAEQLINEQLDSYRENLSELAVINYDAPAQTFVLEIIPRHLVSGIQLAQEGNEYQLDAWRTIIGEFQALSHETTNRLGEGYQLAVKDPVRNNYPVIIRDGEIILNLIDPHNPVGTPEQAMQLEVVNPEAQAVGEVHDSRELDGWNQDLSGGENLQPYDPTQEDQSDMGEHEYQNQSQPGDGSRH